MHTKLQWAIGREKLFIASTFGRFAVFAVLLLKVYYVSRIFAVFTSQNQLFFIFSNFCEK
jgi:hypothetical protein